MERKVYVARQRVRDAMQNLQGALSEAAYTLVSDDSLRPDVRVGYVLDLQKLLVRAAKFESSIEQVLDAEHYINYLE